MDEIEQKKQELEAIRKSQNTKVGVQPESTPLIDSGNQAAERLEKATEAIKEQNDRTEKLQAERRLGGRTDNGEAKPVDSRDENQKDIDYANQITAGSLSVEDVLMPEVKE